eukprot:1195399-Prorocentrum_minimum.AAC.2
MYICSRAADVQTRGTRCAQVSGAAGSVHKWGSRYICTHAGQPMRTRGTYSRCAHAGQPVYICRAADVHTRSRYVHTWGSRCACTRRAANVHTSAGQPMCTRGAAAGVHTWGSQCAHAGQPPVCTRGAAGVHTRGMQPVCTRGAADVCTSACRAADVHTRALQKHPPVSNRFQHTVPTGSNDSNDSSDFRQRFPTALETGSVHKWGSRCAQVTQPVCTRGAAGVHTHVGQPVSVHKWGSAPLCTRGAANVRGVHTGV